MPSKNKKTAKLKGAELRNILAQGWETRRAEQQRRRDYHNAYLKEWKKKLAQIEDKLSTMTQAEYEAHMGCKKIDLMRF